MNKIWIILCLICIGYGFINNRYDEIAKSVLSLSIDALNLSVNLVFSACFWNGIMNIMYESNLIEFIALALKPLLNFVFPKLHDEIAKKYISMNVAANMFGLGFAATPAGLNAIKRLKEISLDGDEASDDMVTFLILNTAGVTLIPTTVIALRVSYGSNTPTDFMIVGIIGTVLSSIGGIFLDKLYKNIRNKKQKMI